MNCEYIELELDQIKAEHSGNMVPKLVTKSSSFYSSFLSSSVYTTLSGVGKHNISGMIKKVASEIEGVKNSMNNLTSFVEECHDNYLNLDTFLVSATNGVTTSSSANSVIGNMSTLDYIHLDFEIPNSSVKLDYEFEFHPIVREEKALLSAFQGADNKTNIKKDEEESIWEK